MQVARSICTRRRRPPTNRFRSVGWINAELALTAIAAMMSPTTLTFSVLAIALGDRPRRTGLWFYVGAWGATLAIGVIAAFVLGDKAASQTRRSPRRGSRSWTSSLRFFWPAG